LILCVLLGEKRKHSGCQPGGRFDCNIRAAIFDRRMSHRVGIDVREGLEGEVANGAIIASTGS
jgi:hypothetical protein